MDVFKRRVREMRVDTNESRRLRKMYNYQIAEEFNKDLRLDKSSRHVFPNPTKAEKLAISFVGNFLSSNRLELTMSAAKYESNGFFKASGRPVNIAQELRLKGNLPFLKEMGLTKKGKIHRPTSILNPRQKQVIIEGPAGPAKVSLTKKGADVRDSRENLRIMRKKRTYGDTIASDEFIEEMKQKPTPRAVDAQSEQFEDFSFHDNHESVKESHQHHHHHSHYHEDSRRHRNEREHHRRDNRHDHHHHHSHHHNHNHRNDYTGYSSYAETLSILKRRHRYRDEVSSSSDSAEEKPKMTRKEIVRMLINKTVTETDEGYYKPPPKSEEVYYKPPKSESSQIYQKPPTPKMSDDNVLYPSVKEDQPIYIPVSQTYSSSSQSNVPEMYKAQPSKSGSYLSYYSYYSDEEEEEEEEEEQKEYVYESELSSSSKKSASNSTKSSAKKSKNDSAEKVDDSNNDEEEEYSYEEQEEEDEEEEEETYED